MVSVLAMMKLVQLNVLIQPLLLVEVMNTCSMEVYIIFVVVVVAAVVVVA